MHLVVAGIPVQQGSKTPWGSEQTAERLLPWRARITDAALHEMHGAMPLAGPVEVIAVFTFPRPKKHYRFRRDETVLRDDAPIFHISYPDLDKLQRAVGDALTGVVIFDDKQIASWRVSKRYSELPGAHIFIRDLEERTEKAPPRRTRSAEEVLLEA